MALVWPQSVEASGASAHRFVLLAFAGVGERELASLGDVSIGIVSASQGSYSADQFLLDLTQGARVATSAYGRPQPPALSLHVAGSSGRIAGWQAARARARGAPQTLSPGLLAAALPGGAGYVGIDGGGDPDAPAAADQDGRVAAVSLGAATTIPARVSALGARERLVVADLPAGPAGLTELAALSRRRSAAELLIVVQRVSAAHGGELLWAGLGGLPGGAGRELTSRTTQQHGLIATVDIAPTVLAWLGRSSPAEMRGTAIETADTLRRSALLSLMARLQVIGGRRLKALGMLLAACALLLLACSPRPSARARAMRVVGLAVLWAPVTVLLTAALEPSAVLEYAAIAGLCIGLGTLADLMLAWPRAIVAPAVAAVLSITADALAHTQLLMRSLLGPDPILGARFYGIGNELKSVLAVMVLAAVAGALYPAARERRAVAATILAGLTLATIEGSAQIGAGVGGVILVSVGFAVACLLLLPGTPARRRALILAATPAAALLALAALDLATAHGNGHFTGSVLHARSPGDLRDIIVRRYSAAWSELQNHVMPAASALSLLCAWTAVRRRASLLAPVGGDRLWLAALGGGLAAGVTGALVEDSGPVLLVGAVFTLGFVLSYLWGCPRTLPSQIRPRRRRARGARARSPSSRPAR